MARVGRVRQAAVGRIPGAPHGALPLNILRHLLFILYGLVVY